MIRNRDGTIEQLVEKIGDDWLIDPSPPPFFLRSLAAAKAADERWRHGEGPAVVDLRESSLT